MDTDITQLNALAPTCRRVRVRLRMPVQIHTDVGEWLPGGQSITAKIQYDVFLSHNSQDKPAVEIITHCLVEAGLIPWLITGSADKTARLWNLRQEYRQTCEQWLLEEEL